MDQRTRRFLIRAAIAWAAYPLGGGIAGMGVAFVGPPLPVGPPDAAVQLVAWSGLGLIVGTMLALADTIWTYWRLFLR